MSRARTAPPASAAGRRILPPHVGALLPVLLVDLAALTVARLALWAAFRSGFEPLTGGTLARSLYLGLKFDLRLLLLVLAPPLALGGLRRLRLVRGAGVSRVWSAYLAVATFLVALTYGFDFGHFAYLRSRLAATALGFLANPLISAQMIWESYPVVWALLGLGVLTAANVLLLRRTARLSEQPAPPAPGRWRRVALAVVLVFAWALGVYGKVSWYPLRWSDAFFGTSDFASSLALNPVLYFADTFKNRDLGYDLEQVQRHYPEVASYLNVTSPDATALAFARQEHPTGRIAGRPNVVVILLESFAWYKCGISGNPVDPSPNLDRLAAGSLTFGRFYVPSFGTARSVFALLTGIPDVETHETSTRNPLIVRQHTIVNAFAGYRSFYFLGGSLAWGNIRGVLKHNIPGLTVFEEGDFGAERVDVWGISDLALFETANRELREVGDEPFFAFIQTSGNHRPYTIPDESRGFEKVRFSDERLRAAGFISNDELNSFRLVDHSLGVFLADAAREPYFDNTVFVLLGDHGYQGRADHVPAWQDELGLTRFHVPFLVYAPGLELAPARVDTVASELDVLPTLAGLLGVPYLNTTLGRDLLDPRADGARYAFTVGDHFSRPRIGLVTDSHYFRSYADGSEPRLYRLGTADAAEEVSAALPAETARLGSLCRGLFETSRYLLYNNAAP